MQLLCVPWESTSNLLHTHGSQHLPAHEQAPHAGIEDSSRLRVRGEGDAGRKGGEMGDLYVFIKVRSHPSLKREGVGIHSTIDVSYVDAILGTNVKVRFAGMLQLAPT